MKKKNCIPFFAGLKQIVQIMKMTIFLTLIFSFQVYASSYGQSGEINLEMNSTLKEVIESLDKTSGYHFVMKYDEAILDKKVRVKYTNESIKYILDDLLKNTGLSYKIIDRYIAITADNSLQKVVSQQKTVIGKVTDVSGIPLPGVTVVIKGTTAGTITDSEGKYDITKVPGDAVLLYSFIGMKSQEIEVSGRNMINVIMEEETIGIEEVVAVGYGTMKKANITGAIAQYNAESLNERPIQRVDQALVGQMAGVHVKQTSGMPGSGLSIEVRGSGSISANNEPLYVIDGFPLEVSSQNSSGKYDTGNPLDNINPNDIESVQVLKDAAAAAIYGSRASNGVVLITTKKGKVGKSKISFNYYTGWNQAQRHVKMLDSEQWLDRAYDVMNQTYLKAYPNASENDNYDTRVANIGSFDRTMIPDPAWAEDGHPGIDFVDWQDEIFQKGAISNYQVSASGGTDAVKYFISSDYLDQDGYILGVTYKRYSARANVEVKVSNKITAGINIAPSYSVKNDPGVEGKDSQFHIALGMSPIVSTAAGGAEFYNTGDYTTYTWGNSRNSPVAVLKNTIGKTKNFRTLTNIFGDYEIIDGLHVRSSLNLDNTDSRYKYYRPAFVSGSLSSRKASGRYVGYNRQTFVNENTVSFDRTFAEKHNVSAVAGMSYNMTKLDYNRIYATDGFGTDYITTLNDANGISASNTYTTETKNVLISYFGRVNYSYMDRYLLSASIRRDGSSRFGNDTKWGVFPAVSLGWRLSDEAFMKNAEWLSILKARASWGISGNNGLGGDYEHIAMLQSSDYSFGGNQVVGLTSENIANSDLSWEQSETYNFGLDFGVFKNRLYGSIEYYRKSNTDLLLNINVPASTGFDNALTNIGEVFNHGWEFELNSKNFTGNFKWNTSLNLSFNGNKIRHLGPDDAPILGGSFDINHNILKVGEPMYSIYVVKQIGILSAEDISNGAALYGSEEEGDPKYEDYDHSGSISADDRQILGHPNPDYTWGLTNTFKYKGFDLSVFIQGQHGGTLYSTFGRAIDRTGTGWLDNQIQAWAYRWRSADNPGNGLKGNAKSSFGRIKNTDWMYSNDYWRIRNITMGYDLKRLIHSNMISGARIYVTAENWFGNDKYDGGANPEAVNTSGDDYGGIPLAKSMIFGVNFTF
ncbi:MAG: TonB-dependent receptor [Dysgonamonadaceae bacterium]